MSGRVEPGTAQAWLVGKLDKELRQPLAKVGCAVADGASRAPSLQVLGQVVGPAVNGQVLVPAGGQIEVPTPRG